MASKTRNSVSESNADGILGIFDVVRNCLAFLSIYFSQSLPTGFLIYETSSLILPFSLAFIFPIP